MKKQIAIIVLLSILYIESYSQIIFESGYFINESNQKTECLIKNIDWKNNPAEFDYKITQDAPLKKGSIKTIKEFGIYGVSKYIRDSVKIDRSGDDITDMSSDKNPAFQEEMLFLKVLIEGKASLFLFTDGNLTRFFYKINGSETEQLVYKRYLVRNNIAENNYFKQQLFLTLKCQGITSENMEDIHYNKRDLEKLFSHYNECTGSNYLKYEPIQKKDVFNLSLRPGLNSSTLAIQNYESDSKGIDFENALSFRFGMEAEFILPFNKNKWGITIEPTYQYYKSEKTMETGNVSGGVMVSKVNYKSIELPVGLRHYFYLNNDSKIFANISYVFDFANNSSIEFLRSNGTIINELEIKPRRNLALGIGYKYKNRYSLEIQYYTNRNILGDYLFWNGDYKKLSIVFGYSLF